MLTFQPFVIPNISYSYSFNYSCISDYDCPPYHGVLIPGKYIFEVWGAQGGCDSVYPGGLGGYSKGTISITSNTDVFINVGNIGETANRDLVEMGNHQTRHSFNGGGHGRGCGGGGGGASDIRLLTNSLNNRIIVAGGGGGAALSFGAGYGGGLTGGSGVDFQSYTVTGGTQLSGGQCQRNSIANGAFGYGGNTSTYTSQQDTGGGGGGWYGGASGYGECSAGAGGSGFVFTSTSTIPLSYSLNNSFWMTDSLIKSGGDSFNGVFGTPETGHSGTGFARITVISTTSESQFIIQMPCTISMTSYAFLDMFIVLLLLIC